MKLKITNSWSEDDLANCLVISPLLGKNIRNLEDVADSECDEIYCNILEKMPISEVASVIKNYTKKLRHGGKIIFEGTDLVQMCLSIINRTTTIFDANNIIYGGPESWNLNLSMICASDISAVLTQLGLKITKRALYAGKYTVEAVRE